MILFPNAKINIGLNITERRPDGYHNIETLFFPVDWRDVLEIHTTTDNTSLITSGIEIPDNPNNNLIIKAHNLIAQYHGIPHHKIHLHKNIPMGAGLGGGSSDAAHLIDFLNKEYKLNINEEQLNGFATQIGADCPFFLHNKPLMAEGIGNIFTPINLSLSDYYIYIIKPEIHVSTPLAYKNCTPKRWELPLKEAIKQPILEWKNVIFNDFEKTVFPQHPELAQLKQLLYNTGAIYAAMSGSGSSIYGIYTTLPHDNEIMPEAKRILNNNNFSTHKSKLI